ncbi:MAG TPA: AMP-binding protein [Actinomycetota bacterium]|nr:AMP-binding protein [Actinomycetota bacterium]
MTDTPLLALRYPNRRMAARLQEVWNEGSAALPVNPALPEAEVRLLLERLRPHSVEDETGVTELRQPVGVNPGTALVMATSGSSGEPKGVILSHQALENSARAYASRLRTGPGERWLCCLPLSHIGGLGILVRSRLAGTEPVVLDSFDVDAVANDRQATLVSLVPTTLRRLLDSGADLARYSAVLIGGAGLSSQEAQRSRDAGVRLVQTYGMTETSGGCNFDGYPLDGVEFRVEGEQILVRGPILMDGYRLRPDLTSEALRDGWLHTADRGRMDAEGRLEVLGRLDDVIVTGGEKVSAAEVEDLLQSHPAVADAAVGPLPDPEWGQAVAAMIVPAAGATPPVDDLKAFVADHIARFKAPKRVFLVSSIPRTVSGKVRRPAVKAQLERLAANGP